jgi:hypothetical protein
MLADLPLASDGVFIKVKHFFWEKSETRRREDREEAARISEAKASQTKQLLESQQRMLEQDQAAALKALEAARVTRQQRREALREAAERFDEALDKRLEASKSLETAKSLLAQLGAEEKSLVCQL